MRRFQLIVGLLSLVLAPILFALSGDYRTAMGSPIWMIAAVAEGYAQGRRAETVRGSLERAAASAMWRKAALLEIFAGTAVTFAAFSDGLPATGGFFALMTLVDAYRFWKDDDGGPWVKQKLRSIVTSLIMRPTLAPTKG